MGEVNAVIVIVMGTRQVTTMDHPKVIDIGPIINKLKSHICRQVEVNEADTKS